MLIFSPSDSHKRNTFQDGEGTEDSGITRLQSMFMPYEVDAILIHVIERLQKLHNLSRVTQPVCGEAPTAL